MEAIICCVACIVCFLVFAGLGVYFCLSKTPANFWSGEKISPSAVSDVKKYNRANGIMWIVYGVLYLIPAVFAFINIPVSGAIICVLTFIGVPILIFIYTKIIRQKYFISKSSV